MTARSPVPRRVALGVLVLGTTTACGIHLEQDAPRVPLVPARTPIAGEDALVGLLMGTYAVAFALDGLPKTAAVARVLKQQAAVVDSALRQRGVPADKLQPPVTAPGASGSGTSSSGTPSSGESSGTASPGMGTRTPTAGPTDTAPSATKGAAEAAARAVTSVLAARGLLSVADVALRPMLAALAASRAVLATRLDTTWQAPITTPAVLEVPVARAVLAGTRAAVYGLEVAAARSTDATRERAVTTLHTLRGMVMAQEALLGAQAPPTPTAYGLPLTVSDNASAKRLVVHLLGALTGAYAAQLPTVAGTPPALLTIADWLAASAQLQNDWGVGLAAFPGLA